MYENTYASQGTITRRAFSLLEDEDAILYMFSSPEAILEHLTDEDEFASLGTLLKRAVTEQGFCEEGADNEVFKSILHTRISAQDNAIMQMYELADKAGFEDFCRPLLGSVRPIEKMTVKRWIDNETTNIRNRSTCIRICTALELDLKHSNEFLNKCGFQALSVRSAADAVLIYCILNKKPLSEALYIYNNYLEQTDNYLHTETNSDPKTASTATTSRLEKNFLSGASWESDEEFLETFLIPNTKSFDSYSRTAMSEYIKIKNPIFLTVLSDKVKEEDVSGRAEEIYRNRKNSRRFNDPEEQKELTDKKAVKDIKFSLNLYNRLKKIQERDSGPGFFKELSESAKFYPVTDGKNYTHFENNLVEICGRIGTFTKEHRADPEIQEEVNLFLSDVISGDSVFSALLPATIDKATDRKRTFTDSELAETVLFKFPHRQSLTEYEKKPADGSLYISIRKAIILMYYYAFAYEFICDDEKGTYFSGLFEEPAFEGFVETVNSVLLKCRYAPLYPGNRFDWLVLVSVRRIEVVGDDKLEDAVSNINDVLAASMNKK